MVVKAAQVMLCALAAIFGAHGQAGERPAFEVASVKPNRSLNGISASTLGRPGGHVEIYNATLRQLIGKAYFSNLSQAQNQVIGMPRWGDSEHFDIDAAAPGNPTMEQKRLMLQSLLADRFKLDARQETRELPVWAVVMAKPGQLGAQLRRHGDEEACPQLPARPAGAPEPDSPAEAATLALQQVPCGRMVGGMSHHGGPNRNWTGGRKVTMEAIAESLGDDDYMDRPTIDRTGLQGHFDFTIEWNTEQQDVAVNPAPNAQGLSLFEALRVQLGLKVETGKGPVRVLVIHGVERPSEN